LANLGLAEVRLLLSQLRLELAPVMVGTASDLSADEQAALHRELSATDFVKRAVAWFPAGRASAFLALASAVDLVSRGAHRYIVVGGIDSLCARETVRSLVRAQRVLGPHTEGTVPAEGAVFAVLARSDDPIVEPAHAVALEGVVREHASVPFLKADR